MEKSQPRFFSKEEITGILDAALEFSKGRYLAPIVVALETGMRLGEVTRLTVGDINLNK